MNTKDIEIKIRKTTTGSSYIKAYVSLMLPIEIDEEKVGLNITNCRIMTDSFNNGFDGLTFSLPQMPKNDGKYKYIVFMNNPAVWTKIKTLVLNQYLNNHLNNKKEEERY